MYVVVLVVGICSCMLVSLLLGVFCTGSSLRTQRAGSRKSVFHDVPERQLDDSLSKSARALLECILEGWDMLAADQCSKARKHWGECDCEARCLMFERYYYDRVQNCRRGTKSERKAVLKDHLIPQFFLEAVIPFPIQKRHRPKWEAKANSTIGANPKY